MKPPWAARASAAAWLAAWPALAPSPARGVADSGGVTAANVLRTPLGARAVGMGGAFAAMDDDLHCMFYNPAGLGTIRRIDLAASSAAGFEGSSLKDFSVGVPLPFGLVGDEHPILLGMGVVLNSYGDVLYRPLAADQSALPVQTLNAGRDTIFVVSAGQRIFDDHYRVRGRRVAWEHYAGLGVKVIQSTLAEQYQARGGALDLGYLVRVPHLRLAVGGSVLNLGPPMRFLEGDDPMPTSVRMGAKWHPVDPEKDSILTTTLDFEFFTHEREFRGQVGAEYVYQRFFSLRVGHRFRETFNGVTLGLGAFHKGFSINWAFFHNALFNSSRFDLSWRFGVPWGLKMGRGIDRSSEIEEPPDLRGLDRGPRRRGEGIERRLDPLIIPGWNP